MNSIKVWLTAIAGIVVLLLVIGIGWVRSSLPALDGTVILEGPRAPITIARDTHGVPHISADSESDLFFATGYVHAQDRLWQMEMSRRAGLGRLSEMLGPDTLSIDRYFRTLGFADRAASAWETLDEDTRTALQTYADGVNAYLKSHKGTLPPEFLLVGTKPEPWSPIDTLVWQKMMWLSLSGNMRQELARARLLTTLSADQLHTIYPTYPGDMEPPFPDMDAIYAALPLERTIAMIGGELPEGIGSNNWVISGERTKSGKPLLANDPHLGLTTPSIWYLLRLHNNTTGANLVGVGFPGSPSIILGRNDKIAWGFTNTAPDVQDFFIEKLVGEDEYLTPEGPAPFIIRNELIKVKGGEDVLLKVRETRHGPVMDDALSSPTEFKRDGYVLALQWTALQKEDTAVRGLLALAHSKNFEAFKAAGRFYFGPEQNMVFADTSGNIGYYAPALVPIRHPENEIMGRLPSPGWLARYDWQGFIPYDQLPTHFNPEGGLIATANEKIVGEDYPYYMTRDWAQPYRGNRIRHLLEATEKHDLASFTAIQQDITSDMARELAPLVAAATGTDPELKDVAEALAAWDGTMAADRPEPLIFYDWLRHYQAALMADDLGDMYGDFKRLRTRLIKSTLFWSDIKRTKIAPAYYEQPPLDRESTMAWCDNIQTDATEETCLSLAVEAMRSTIKGLSEKYGPEWKNWRWGDDHILVQAHRPLSQVPFLKEHFELTTPIGGSTHTINVAGVSQSDSSQNQSTFGPSYRGIFDLSDLDKSLYAHPTGQSGNPLSNHYDDLFPLWRDGVYFKIETKDAVPKDSRHVLKLVPAR
ncbi:MULTISPECIES: penicillin acylase family protein [Kordiimonas]|jgi:penicillin amidase|uniref:penicillin acylase family protein n=1 Tax=Kordiimonas TaxID=288021 RepID=UPI00257A7919|nr:penicillin acylase family protein [Kordiimonas sp. UBA4487]